MGRLGSSVNGRGQPGATRKRAPADATSEAAVLASATRALRVLKVFSAGRRDVGVTELARELGLSKSSAHLLLATLHQEGFVQRSSANGRYELGGAAIRLGVTALDNVGFGAWSQHILQALAEKTRETATIGILDHQQVLFVQRVDSREVLRVDLKVGTRLALHASALGKLLLATMPEPDRELLLADLQLPRLAEHTITDFDALHAELAEVARRGYAESVEEILPGISVVAGPIRNWTNQVVAGVSLAWPTGRRTVDDHLTPVLAAAAELSAGLGYRHS
ncbi:MAG: IclR family transcriptional regulator [Chloroflexi bacterium]|nr:IclR family transcriptional regulator [Chloroflexota bacterium]